MKSISLPKLAGAGEGYALLLGVGAVVFVGITLFLKTQAKAAATAIANVNAGTDYAGTGAIGTVGNITNQVSGGALASIGENLGGWLYGVFNPAYDPNAGGTGAVTFQTRKQAVIGGVPLGSAW